MYCSSLKQVPRGIIILYIGESVDEICIASALSLLNITILVTTLRPPWSGPVTRIQSCSYCQAQSKLPVCYCQVCPTLPVCYCQAQPAASMLLPSPVRCQYVIAKLGRWTAVAMLAPTGDCFF